MVRGFLSFLIDALVPRSCLGCARELGPLGAFAAGGAPGGSGSRMQDFLATPCALDLCPGISIPARVLCETCWLRLEPARPRGLLALPGAPGRSVPLICPFFTNDELLALVRFLKFSGGRTAAPALGWWMARALEDHRAAPGAFAAGKTVLVPVPLHPSREKSRGYNQAFLLAWEVGERLGLDVEARVLGRIRNTKSQSTLDRERRAFNVREAFGTVRADLIMGRDVIVVDDLVTTGETAAACVAALEPAEPSSIAVLAAGRVRD
ncbi:MAG TPA: hypothetical protein VII85_03645 [Candidatus Krumholzibacteriaceae bacterium]